MVFFHDTDMPFIKGFISTSIEEIMSFTQNTCFGFIYNESSNIINEKINSSCSCMILKEIEENLMRRMKNVLIVHGLSSKIRELLAIERIDSYRTYSFILNPKISP